MVLADSLHRYSLIFAGTLIVFINIGRDGKRVGKGKESWCWEMWLGLFLGVGGQESQLNLIVTINNIIHFNFRPVIHASFTTLPSN